MWEENVTENGNYIIDIDQVISVDNANFLSQLKLVFKKLSEHGYDYASANIHIYLPVFKQLELVAGLIISKGTGNSVSVHSCLVTFSYPLSAKTIYKLINFPTTEHEAGFFGQQ